MKKTVKQRQVAILLKSVRLWNWYRKISGYKTLDLTYADLTDANLTDANLTYADLDYSSIPLWCGSLKAKFDQKHIYQILYHSAKPCYYDHEIVQDEDLKNLLNLELFKRVANKFHRSKECGEL